MRTAVKVIFSIPGYHCWPTAPVSICFLRDSHRHIFIYIVTIEVYHHDREIEFFLIRDELKTWVESRYPMGAAGAYELESSSCEELAQEVIKYIIENYPGRRCSVEVSEDGTNSSIVTFEGEGK